MNTPKNQSITSDPSLSGAEIMRQFLPNSPYVGHLGIQLTDMQPDIAVLTLPFTPAIATLGTIVHGGAIASLIDTAAMVAAWSNAGVQNNPRGTTVGLTVNYLSAGNGEDLVATARVLRRGRSLVYLDIDVLSTSGNAVAKGLVTYKLG
ncbi:MAG TPA: PaaI family thioesterase [Ktedonosporobacter sp.]|nr:PaaI family thioesterase [Ktedonosporobacter sp.]